MSDNKILVSIIVPLFNEEKTILSVLNKLSEVPTIEKISDLSNFDEPSKI